MDTSSLPPLIIKGKETYPIVQGGMGVGVSNGNLAGAVAREGGIGTLSSVGLAWIEKYRKSILSTLIQDEKLKGKITREQFTQLFYDASLKAAEKEIEIAKQTSNNNGALWLNTMVAIKDYDRHVQLACETGLDGIVSGAGLPLNLPTLTKDYPNIALIPILSNLRGVQIVMKKWERLGKIPDAIVLEDPTRAGGHLGASSLQDFDRDEISKSTLEVAVPEVRKFLAGEGLENTVPIIAAGGITTYQDIRDVIELGASGAQLGTRFLTSHESGANDEFKQSIIEADNPDKILLYTSNALLPARALKKSGAIQNIDTIGAYTRRCTENCLQACAYRDGIKNVKLDTPAQICILDELAKSVNPTGGTSGLMFTGTSALAIKSIESVHDIMMKLLGKI